MFLRNFRGEGSPAADTKCPQPLEDSAENIFHIMHMHLVKSNPALGLSLAISLFSMAGLPPLIGFFAKLSVLYSASQQGFFFLAVVAVTTSVVSGGYYLRVVRVIMHEQPLTEFAHPAGLRHYVPTETTLRVADVAPRLRRG
jgi:NADH-ubiquinone oxidoreductase chain 2